VAELKTKLPVTTGSFLISVQALAKKAISQPFLLSSKSEKLKILFKYLFFLAFVKKPTTVPFSPIGLG